MSKYILTFSSLLLLSVSAFADPADSFYLGLHNQRLERLSKELALTDEQKAKLESIYKAQAEKYRQIHEQAHREISEVLNADQVAKWEIIVKQRQENRRKHALEE